MICRVPCFLAYVAVVTVSCLAPTRQSEASLIYDNGSNPGFSDDGAIEVVGASVGRATTNYLRVATDDFALDAAAILRSIEFDTLETTAGGAYFQSTQGDAKIVWWILENDGGPSENVVAEGMADEFFVSNFAQVGAGGSSPTITRTVAFNLDGGVVLEADSTYWLALGVRWADLYWLGSEPMQLTGQASCSGDEVAGSSVLAWSSCDGPDLAFRLYDTAVPVPELGSASLFSAGALVVGAVLTRRHRKAA